MSDQRTFRSNILGAFGADEAQIAELLRYNEDGYKPPATSPTLHFPLMDEPFLPVWKHYARRVRRTGTIAGLSRYLVQLRFPVREGISQTEAYLNATRKGAMNRTISTSLGLELVAPEQCTIEIQPTPAGSIPLIVARARRDFESLVQAFTCRNEPVPVPKSQGACMVAGYNNWHQILLARRRFERTRAPHAKTWAQEFQELRERKDLYQDRFILLSDGPYSGVPGKDLDLEDAEWRRLSLVIRREHEATHYFTRRVLGCMRNNLRDELIADYFGIVAARGSYRKDWFLRFLGIHTDDGEGSSRRFMNYRGVPPLSDGAMSILRLIVKRAAENLELFDRRHANTLRQGEAKPFTTLAISALTLEELSSDTGEALLTEVFLRIMDQVEEAQATKTPGQATVVRSGRSFFCPSL